VDITNRILQGNNYEILDQLPAGYFHTIVTSPPYWGLRNYKTIPQIWPNPDKEIICKHNFLLNQKMLRTGGENGKMTNTKKQRAVIDVNTCFCSKCGAWKGELGLEPTPELYIQHLVMIFRKVWRVLRDDGTFWLNLGDSYWGSGGTSGHNENTTNMGRKTHSYGATSSLALTLKKHPVYKAKDLCMIPARIAIALQEDGWFLRSDIIWSKQNPMPESVIDRPTKSHEYIYLLTKAPHYYYDAVAIREKPEAKFKGQSYHNPNNPKYVSIPDEHYKQQFNGRVWGEPTGRNKRSVWTIATTPFPDAHFATFPPALVEPAILAGTSEYGCCSICGKPYERIIEKPKLAQSEGEKAEKQYRRREGDYSNMPGWENYKTNKTKYEAKETAGKLAKYRNEMRAEGIETMPEIKTIGWKKTCKCNTKQHVPCRVLDPFAGSGTTGQVARQAGREFTGIELNPDYIKISDKRIGHLLSQMDIQL